MPAVAATVALLVVTRRGAYVSPDSIFYLGTARSLVGGGGYDAPPGSAPLSNFPPLYPLLLAAVGAFGPDPLTVARYAGPLLFGLTVLAVGLVVRRLTGSLRLAVAGQLLVASGADFLAYHSAALSEGLFLALALLALLAVAAALRSQSVGWVLPGGLLAGAATLTRFLGLAVVLAGAGAFLFLEGGRRWKRAVAFAAVALAPLAVWLVWVSGAEGKASNRTAAVHAPDAEYFVAGLRSATTWIVPEEVPAAVRAVVSAIVVLALVAAWRRSRDRGADDGAAARASPVPPVLALFAVAYVLALVGDRWLFDVTGRLDARFLLPLHAVAVVVGLRMLTGAGGGRSKAATVGLGTVVALQLVSGVYWVYDASTDASIRPGGFTAPAWRQSAVIDLVRGLPRSAPVFTNQPDALWFHTGRVAEPVPEKNVFLTGQPNRQYERQLDAMRARLGRDGVLVYFTASPARRVFLPKPDELAARLGLERVKGDEVGAVYRVP